MEWLIVVGLALGYKIGGVGFVLFAFVIAALANLS